jgi:hypothetical protein
LLTLNGPSAYSDNDCIHGYFPGSTRHILLELKILASLPAAPPVSLE